MKLYEIQKSIEDILESVDEETGEIPENLCEKLALYEGDKLVKVENTVHFMKNLESDIEAIKNEETRLNNLRKSRERRLEWIKKYLLDNLHGETFKEATWQISYRKSE